MPRTLPTHRAVSLLALLALLALLPLTATAAGAEAIVGKKPGEIQGRWLRVQDVSELKAHKGVYLGEVKTDIQWKKASNEAPIDEKLLDEKIREHLLLNLRQSKVFAEVRDSAPAAGTAGWVRLDCDLVVEPGSRAARYAVGFGAGKSRSILEIHLRDHKSGNDLGLYHGYGVGSGMGFKLAGGSARKMTQDDIQENTKMFVELLGQIR